MFSLKNLFNPDFLLRLGGAGLSALIDGGVEASWEAGYRGFPFGVIDLPLPLPPLDDWLVWGGSMATWMLGAWKGKPGTTMEKVRKIGEGMTLYATGMIIHHTIIRAGWMMRATPAAAAPTVPPTVAELLARKGYTPTKAVQLRNGRYTPTMPGRLGYTPTA